MFPKSVFLASLPLCAVWVMTSDASAGQSRDQQAQPRMRFEAMDTNNDGQITRAEWRGSARSFEVHDWNGDGRLSGNEVRVGGWGETSAIDQADHDPSRAERFMSWNEAGFNSLDHNRDREITANEWHFDRETFLRADRNRDGALSRTEFLDADFDDDRGDRFDDLDSNANGRIERSEWHASLDAFEWLDRDGNGYLSRAEVTGFDQREDAVDEFASLDYDGDGTVTRSEWHWSAGSFNRLDQNRDGVLSRREYVNSTAGAGAGSGELVRVSAQQDWTDTGIIVRAGDVLNIDARGTIAMGLSPEDTATPAGSTTGRRADKAPVNAPAGALIARIGTSTPFLIGDRRSVPVPQSGRLYLGVNDDHMPDNTGEFQVSISVSDIRN